MKYSTLLSLLFLPMTAAAGSLDCDSSWRWLALSGIEPLQHQGDQAITAGCQWQASLYPQRRRWLPALPSLRYERALATDLSRSKGYIRYQYWSAQLPLWRSGQTLLGVETSSDYRQQSHQLTQSLMWQNSVLAATQTLILDSTQRQTGLYLDLQALNSPVTHLWLRYRQQWQATTIRINQADELANTEQQSWILGIERQPTGYGLQLVGWLAMGHGQMHNDGDAAELNRAGLNNDFILLNISAGVYWRHRLGQQLDGFFYAGVNASYYQYPDAADSDIIAIDSYSELDYRSVGGLRWRF